MNLSYIQFHHEINFLGVTKSRMYHEAVVKLSLFVLPRLRLLCVLLQFLAGTFGRYTGYRSAVLVVFRVKTNISLL